MHQMEFESREELEEEEAELLDCAKTTCPIIGMSIVDILQNVVSRLVEPERA